MEGSLVAPSYRALLAPLRVRSITSAASRRRRGGHAEGGPEPQPWRRLLPRGGPAGSTGRARLADQAITAGSRALLFPSLRHPGGTNRVIFPATMLADDKVEVHDPDHRLPRDPSSWA
ncbi:RES family NAD+ phosphorylase [Ancylobacter sp. FA202]|uniref:RES family NAD+ phosphorylase n=1 Tax=Ancylobacter sp. FA202 TaxID=1111106 RepID=UPI001FD90F7B|nr:RES family NAD+ phosphorylase [Ancylobacter sp. FA202]